MAAMAVSNQIQPAAAAGMAAAAMVAAQAAQAPVLTVAGSVIPQTPQITGNVDPTKIDEIRRTVYVGNLSTHVSSGRGSVREWLWFGGKGCIKMHLGWPLLTAAGV